MLQLQKIKEWRVPFTDAVTAAAAEAHVWGPHDCLTGLVAPAVFAMTGHDIAAPYRGRYDSPESAMALLKAEGFADLGDWLASLFPECSRARANIGDVVTIVEEGGPLAGGMGMVIGARVAVLAERGKGTVALKRIHRAFRVG